MIRISTVLLRGFIDGCQWVNILSDKNGLGRPREFKAVLPNQLSNIGL